MQRVRLQKMLGSTSPWITNANYTPSITAEGLRFYLWLTIQFDKDMCTTVLFDYTMAYLNSRKKSGDKIFIRLPKGLKIDGMSYGEINIYFYGMIDAGLKWYENLVASIHSAGEKLDAPFTQNVTDPTLHSFLSSTLIVLVLVNTDDCLLHVVSKSSREHKDKFLKLLAEDYAFTVDTEIKRFFGLNITWGPNRDWVKVSMEDKITELEEIIKFDTMATVNNTLPANFDSTPMPADHINYHEPFSTLNGKIVFIGQWRPDISAARTKLAPFMHKFGKYHWECLLHLAKYLHQTKKEGMFLKRSPTWDIHNTKCEIISDAGDLANPNTGCRATFGHVLIVENNIISFKGKVAKEVTTESSNTELLGYYAATKNVKGFLNFVSSLHPIRISTPVTLYGDNLAALWIARNNTNSTRTKHYHLKLHYIFEQIQENNIITKHIPGVLCIADILTKIQTNVLFAEQRVYYVAECVDDLHIFVAPLTDKSDISK